MTLDEFMYFGRVVYSDGEGNVTDPEETVYGPEYAYVETDDNGYIVPGQDIYIGGYSDWELLKGFTGQYGVFMTEIMHHSEYIGGRLERHIRENRGYYVAVLIECEDTDDDDDSMVGWGVAFKPE